MSGGMLEAAGRSAQERMANAPHEAKQEITRIIEFLAAHGIHATELVLRPSVFDVLPGKGDDGGLVFLGALGTTRLTRGEERCITCGQRVGPTP